MAALIPLVEPALWLGGGVLAALGVSQIKDGVDRVSSNLPPNPILPPQSKPPASVGPSTNPTTAIVQTVTPLLFLAGGAVIVVLLGEKALKGL